MSLHPIKTRARPAALAALCADQQEKFWPYHDRLFENARALEDEDLFVGASASHYLGRHAGSEAIAALERYVNRAETDPQKRAAGDAIKFIRQRAAAKQ